LRLASNVSFQYSFMPCRYMLVIERHYLLPVRLVAGYLLSIKKGAISF
jgi:hypothetical protein